MSQNPGDEPAPCSPPRPPHADRVRDLTTMAASSPHGSPTSSWTTGWFIALMGWTTLMSFYHLGSISGFATTTDAWVAQTAREMRESGEWIVPHFAGEPFLQKSPGPYWAVILISLLRGTPVDEFATRAPNALAAVVMIATLFWMTRRIGGDRAAVFAGFAASGSIFVLYWSHRGNAELALACCVTVSLACLWMASHGDTSGWKRKAFWLIGYFAAGVGMIYKMPMPLVCVGVPAFFYLLLRRRWRVLWNKWHLLGLVLFVLPWLPWVIALCLREPMALDKWRVEFVDRFTGAMPNQQDVQGDWRRYFMYLIPPVLWCLPFSLSLPRAIVRGVRKDDRYDRDGMLFMLIWFFSLFMFFTASAGKELRYFLPAMPPLFVLLGCELAVFFDPQRSTTSRRDNAGAIAVWILVPVAVASGYFGLRIWQKHNDFVAMADLVPPYLVAGGILVAGTAVSAWFYRGRRENVAFGALVATMWVLFGWVLPNLLPLIESQQPVRDIARQLSTKLPAEYRSRLRNIGDHDPRLIWLTDLRYPRVYDQLELLDLQGGRRSLEFEKREVGKRMVDLLSAPDPILFVASRPDYVLFMLEAPRELAKEGRTMPPVHIWLQTEIGQKYHRKIIFGNKVPPWGDVTLDPPSDRLEDAQRERKRLRAAPTNGT